MEAYEEKLADGVLIPYVHVHVNVNVNVNVHAHVSKERGLHEGIEAPPQQLSTDPLFHRHSPSEKLPSVFAACSRLQDQGEGSLTGQAVWVSF